MKTKKNLYIVYFGMFMTQFANMVYPMLTMILQDKMSMSATQISYILVINFIFLAVASFIGGKIADSFNKKNVILVFDAVSVITYILGGILPFSYFTVCLIILAGTFQQLEIASYSMLVNELSEDDQKDKAFATLYMSINVGMFLSSAVSGFLILKYTSLVFYLNAAGVLISALIIAGFLRYEPFADTETEESGEKQPQNSKKMSVFTIFKLVPVLFVYLLMCAITDSVHNQYAYIVPLEITRTMPGNNSEIYGTMISFSCLVIILLTTLISNILHKRSHYAKMRLSNLSQGIGYGILFVGFLRANVPLLYVGFFVYILGEIFDSLYYEAYMVEKVPDEYCGRVYGVFSTVLKISVMIVDLVTGRLYDKNPNSAWVFIFILIAITLFLTETIRIWDGISDKKGIDPFGLKKKKE